MTTKKNIELLFSLLPAIFLFLMATLFFCIIPSFLDVPSNLSGGNQINFSAIIINAMTKILTPIALILFVIATLFAIIGAIRYHYWVTGQQPSCPHCGSMMRIRRAKRGRYKGQKFWGCSRYFISGCRGIIHIG